MLNLVVVALSLAGDCSIRGVLDEASDAEFVGFLDGVGSEADTLHLAVDLVRNSLRHFRGCYREKSPHIRCLVDG